MQSSPYFFLPCLYNTALNCRTCWKCLPHFGQSSTAYRPDRTQWFLSHRPFFCIHLIFSKLCVCRLHLLRYQPRLALCSDSIPRLSKFLIDNKNELTWYPTVRFSVCRCGGLISVLIEGAYSKQSAYFINIIIIVIIIIIIKEKISHYHWNRIGVLIKKEVAI